MAMKWDGTSSTGSYAECSSPNLPNSFVEVSVLALVKPTVLTTNIILHREGAVGSVPALNFEIFDWTLPAYGIQLYRQTDGTPQRFRSDETETNHPLNDWVWVACAMGDIGSTSNALYTSHPGGSGTFQRRLTLPSGTYNQQLNGTGNQADATSMPLWLGRAWYASRAEQHFGRVYMWTRRLSLDELRATQFGNVVRNGLVGEWHPGLHGVSTIPDLSGAGNHMTVVNP